MQSNYYEFKTNCDQIKVQTIEYRNPENLSEFRSKYDESTFMRYRDLVYIWPSIDFYHSKDVIVDKTKDKYLFNRILSEPIINQFFELKDFYISKSVGGYRITDYRNDLSTNDLPFLSIYRSFYLNFSPIQFSRTICGCNITSGISLRLNWNLEDFKSNSIEYEDLTVFGNNEVKADSIALYRIAEYYGLSSKVKSLLDKLNNDLLEYQNCKSFIKEFINDPKGTTILPNGISLEDAVSVDFEAKTNQDIGVMSIKESKLYFYNNSTPKGKAIEYAMRSKIKYNKPVSYDFFEHRDINIGVVYPKEHYLKIASFIKAVQEELITIYKIPLSKFKYTRFPIEDSSLPSYQSIFQNTADIDLAIVVVDELHERLPVKLSPYFFCKAEFIKRGINSQEVQIQQVNKFLLDKAGKVSNYADHTIALNIYAKLGGTAWAIKPQGDTRNELVIGVGSTSDQKGSPQIGMTSVFRGDGKYLIGDISAVVSIDDYNEYLIKVIKKSIDECLAIKALDPLKPIYMVFHLFKKAGKYNEVDALQKAINSYPHLDMKYSFVYVGDGHNYRFYDFKYASDKSVIGFGTVNRGKIIKLNEELSFISLRKNSSVFSKIEIDSRSNVIDIGYLTNQVFDFSNLSHTSFNKQASPASIKYSKLMARMSMKLKAIDGFYMSQISMPDNTPWFL
jgi:hypothetical protein